MMRAWYLIIVVLTAVIFIHPAYAEKPLTNEQALDILMLRISKDRLYNSWTSFSCLSFVIEDAEDEGNVEIAVREKHGGVCPGDPNVSPIVDRYRVNRSTKEIKWYDPVDGVFLPYAAVVEKRLGK